MANPLKTPIPKSTMDSISSFIDNALARSGYSPANTATGTNTVTLNTTSGAAVFTNSIDEADVATFTINNSYFRVGQYIGPILSFDGGGIGNPILCSYVVANGTAQFKILNFGTGNPTGSEITIQFKIQ